MFKLFFSTGTIGLGIAVAALTAWSHSVTPLQATTASSINPAEMMATYNVPLAAEAMGRYLTCFSGFLPSDLAPAVPGLHYGARTVGAGGD